MIMEYMGPVRLNPANEIKLRAGVEASEHKGQGRREGSLFSLYFLLKRKGNK